MTTGAPRIDVMPRRGKGTDAEGPQVAPTRRHGRTPRSVCARGDGSVGHRAAGRFPASDSAFGDIYDWPTEVKDDQLDAEYWAPTSGGPPYDVYELTPHKAFGFPTDGETFAPTRWRFHP